VSRRAEIEMTAAEVASFLAGQRTLICATNGVGGWPHLMPLWFTLRGTEVWCWTYAKSQKTRNLERDARATLQAEAGTEYEHLRGVMMEAQTTIHRDLETVTGVGLDLAARYGNTPEESIRIQAAKRVALEFRVVRVASWDHRKLGGTR